ncbi:MAG: tetratricopeptide repeat protein [Thermoanaerobaculales bacterium]
MHMRCVTLSFCSFLVLAAASVVIAVGQARFGGVVTDTGGNPLPDAIITITSDEVSSFHKEIKVGKDGTFKALILDATRVYLLHVEAPGYQPAERVLDIDIGTSDSFFEFALKSHEELAVSQEQDIREQPGYKEFLEGRELLATDKNEEARAKFAAAVEALPKFVPALAALAELDQQAGLHEEALAAAHRCLEEDEEAIDCLAIAANACQSLGDEEGRAAFLARYKELNPEDPTILFNSAVAFLNKMDDEGARPLLERCLQANPDFPECLFEYGMLQLRSGDMEGAKTSLEHYVEVAPDAPDAATAVETIKYL